MQRDKIKKVMDACYLAKRVRDLLPKLPNGVTSTHSLFGYNTEIRIKNN